MLGYLQLFWEFFKIGLFSIGGGLATLPFLYDLKDKTGWITDADVSNMIAISECTPGPLGINMATYVGNVRFGVLGGIVSTTGLVAPSVIIIVIIAQVLTKFRDSPLVQKIMYGLRPASTGLIAVAMCSVAANALLNLDVFRETNELFFLFDYRAILLAGILIFAIRKWKLHPFIYIASAAVVGIVLGF